jgi:hypothetical protein
LDSATARVKNLLAGGKVAEAIGLLSSDFIGQVGSLRADGKLTTAEAAALTLAAQEAVQNITA